MNVGDDIVMRAGDYNMNTKLEMWTPNETHEMYVCRVYIIVNYSNDCELCMRIGAVDSD